MSVEARDAGAVDPVSAAAASAVEIASAALGGAQVLARVEHVEGALTRFADSAIHQNVADDTWSVSLTAHRDGRSLTLTGGLAGAGDLGGTRALVQRLADGLALAPLDPGWPGVAPAAAVPPPGMVPTSTPAERAEVVAAFVAGAGGLSTAGYVATTWAARAVATSAGQLATSVSGHSALDGIARRDGVDGTSRGAVRSLAELDPFAAGALAAAKVRAGADAVELAPGRYEVLLEPAAAANLLSTLAMWGFNARFHLDGSSFVELGAQQLDPALTIIDDAAAWGVTVDAEGTPKQRLTVVDAGRSAAVAHHRRTAAEIGAASTGHDLGSGMPIPTHLAITPGAGERAVGPVGPVSAPAVPLLAGIDRALLVSDFWYTRVLDPRQVTVTGLTRNGVWLVERGEIVGSVQNVRFTQSYPGALAPGQVLGVGPVSVVEPAAWLPSGYASPALHLASWNVTGNASG